MWDTFYGKKNNPYDADDFRIILYALRDQVTRCPEESLNELLLLIERTREALETELDEY